MELALGIIGGVLFGVLVFGNLALSSLLKRKNNKQKKLELAKARRQVKVYLGHDDFTDELVLLAKGKTTAELIDYTDKTDKIVVHFEVPDRDGLEIVESCEYDVEDMIKYIEIL